VHHEEIHTSDRKSRSKEHTGIDRNRQEQTGTDRSRQEQTGTDRNYCIMKKFIYQIENPEVRNRQEQTGTDRNRQE
jgi:hypothetical protein